VGGVHPTIEPDSVLNEPYVDYIIRGEGEEPFLEFCDGFDKKSKNLGEIRNINKNPLRPLMDVNKLKFPDYSLVDLKDYGQIFISTSRGCPGACTFCYNVEMWGKGGHPCVRFFNTEKTKQLFTEAIEKYGIREFTIADENFTTFKKRCVEVCDFLYERYRGIIDFFVFARADFIEYKQEQNLEAKGYWIF
jgi:radical SAM superfamily enzyme YgiQ (UPF0313 family)